MTPARSVPRLRSHHNLHATGTEPAHRLQVAMEPGSYVDGPVFMLACATFMLTGATLMLSRVTFLFTTLTLMLTAQCFMLVRQLFMLTVETFMLRRQHKG